MDIFLVVDDDGHWFALDFPTVWCGAVPNIFLVVSCNADRKELWLSFVTWIG